MSKREEVRDYRMSDAALIQVADDIQDSVNRDLGELIAYGVDASVLDALVTARNEFRHAPTDSQLSGKMVGATFNKNTARQDLLIGIRQVTDRARIKLGDNHQIVREFGVEMLSKQNDNDLARTAFVVVDVAREHLVELASEGLTIDMVTQLEASADNFDSLIDLQKKAIKNRDFAVDTRIRLGNHLYKLIVNLAAKGKLCWGEVNEAKYNDYVLNESRSKAGHVADGAVAANSVVNISVTGITPATVITLENTGSVPLSFYFSASPLDTTGLQTVVIQPGIAETHPVTAMGYDEANNITRLNVNNTGPVAGGYSVEWV